jgi:hypothetical protein
VVIGYGKVKKSDLTGSVSSVSAKDLAATPAMNALQALQGRAAGLNIVTAGELREQVQTLLFVVAHRLLKERNLCILLTAFSWIMH